MTAFADSSALAKLYADEPESAQVRALRHPVISALARVEVPSALWRKHRLGELSATDAQVLVTAFETDLMGSTNAAPVFIALSVTADILEAAGRACAAHGLRAYDAIQLATVLAARAVDPAVDAFHAFDRDLLQAAAAEGFITNA